MNNKKNILGKIFGDRRLKKNEENEKMLGYEL